MERQRAVQRVATHILEQGHEFNFAGTRMMARASNKTGTELLGTWVSNVDTINRPRALFTRPRGAAQFQAKDARRHDAVVHCELSLIANPTLSSSYSSSSPSSTTTTTTTHTHFPP
ncbi:hypothetical protein SprV_0100472000 [Sparganum proliferum]